VPAFRRSLIPLLFIAFVAAIVATAIFYGFFASKLRNASTGASGQPIVVAVRRLERGKVLKTDDVKLFPWGGASPFKGGYSTVGQITGKTLYNAVEENEPITQRLTGSLDGTGGSGISTGMRAISVHASDSNGVLSLLRIGEKVDVQVVSERHHEEWTLRTVLQDVEVLAVHPPDSNGGRAAAPVVTLLVTPAAADQLGVADSGARIRLLLRNPLDQNEDSRPKVTLTDVYTEGGGALKRPDKTTPQRSLATSMAGDGDHVPGVRQRIHLLVRLAGVQSKAFEEVAARLHFSRHSELLQVVPLPPGRESERALLALEASRKIEVLLSTDLATGDKRSVSMQTGSAWNVGPHAMTSDACGLRIRFLPFLGPKGSLRLRVEPEITVSRANGVASHKMETEVDLQGGQSFLVMGLSDADDNPVLTERLFHGHLKETAKQELMVLITAQVFQPVHAGALAVRR
jgi:Flp pilus assembly protein CpaB